MSSVDERVVRVTFDYRQFEQGINSTLESLDKLNKGLKLQGAAKGLDDVGAAAKGLSLSGIASGVESIANKFKTLSIVGISVLTNLANRALSAGLNITKALTIDPIKAGFANYETQIKAVQTILANTASEGTKIGDVNKVLAELNTYANKTVYNFSEMVQNIGTFTAAGVKLKPAAESIKGIANLAALSGSNSEQASSAMYQLSQAIAAGSVKLQDWNSVVNAGLGGKTFQTALINTARANGVAIDSIIKKAGSFRESLQKGWLTSNILTKTLAQFTGDLSEKQIRAMGFSKAEAEQIMKTGKMAVDAATKIKTMSQLTDALKEEVATAWAGIFKTIFGGIGQATTLFTSAHNVLENALTSPVNHLNDLLEGWAKLGGRTAAIDAIKDAFQALGSVLKPIGEAFKEVFPPETAEDLYHLTVTFRDFIERLKIGGTTAENLKRTFAGVFAIFKIGFDVIGALGKALFSLFGSVSNGSGGFLQVTASIGDFLVGLEKAIDKSKIFTSFFGTIASILSVPIQLLEFLGLELGNLFARFDSNRATKDLKSVSDQINSLGKYSHVATAIWDTMSNVLDTVAKKVDEVWDKIEGFFRNLGTLGSTTNNSFGATLAGLDTGLLAGIILIVHKLVSYLTKGGKQGPVSDIVNAIKEPFEELTNTLKAMQTTLKAATLLEIAAAIVTLAYGVSILSKINSNGLVRASVAISVMFGQLLGAMAIFQKFIGTSGFIKIPIMMLSMIELASAVDVLAKAVSSLAKLSWDGLSKGLTGLATTMAVLAGGVRLIGNPEGLVLTAFGLTEMAGAINGLVLAIVQFSKLNWSGLAKGITGLDAVLASLALFSRYVDGEGSGAIQTAGIVLLAFAIKVLVSAIQDFQKTSWETIGKGLGGIAALLASLALFTKFSRANAVGVLSGTGLVLLASGIKILVSVVNDFDQISWEGISKGLTGIAVLLGSLALFTKFAEAGKTGILQGAGLVLLATSIRILVKAVQSFAGFSWEEIAKGLVTLGGSLIAISDALRAIPATASVSALGVLGVSVALGLIAKNLVVMGNMSWTSIAKSLIEMLASFAIITAALTVIPPTAVASAAAILIVSLSLGKIADALAKMGAMPWEAIAKSLIELGGSLAIIAGAMILMTEALPGAAALLVVAYALSTLAPALAVMGSMSWGGILKSLVELAGVLTLIGVAGVLLTPVVPTLIGLGAAIALIGVGVLAAGLGLSLFAGSIRVLGENVSGFNKQISKAGPGLVKSIETILKSMTKAVLDEIPKIANALFEMLTKMLVTMQKYVPRMVDMGLKLLIGILNGIQKNENRLITVATSLVVTFINSISKNLGRVIQAGFNFVISFVNGVASAIRRNSAKMGAAGGNLGSAIIEGMIRGMASGIYKIASAAANLGEMAIKAAKHALNSHSPSKEFIKIGEDVDNGFAIGLTGNKAKINSAFSTLESQLRTGINDSANVITSLTTKLKKLDEARSKDRAEINSTKAALAQANKEHKAENAAYTELTKNLSSSHSKLGALADQYDKLTTKINDANSALADTIKTRDDFNTQTTQQFELLPDITGTTQVSDYVASLQQQIADTKTLATTLQTLRKLGLNDDTYKQLLAGGIADLPFAQQLLAGGQSAVKQVNDLDKQLDTAASNLGLTASKALYQAAVDSAQGLVDGLKKQQSAIEKQMDAIADAMVKAIKKKLGIHSPSKVFGEIGGFSAEGLANGFAAASSVVDKSASEMGQTAISSLRESLSNLSDLITGDIDVNPTITPVLDLSGIKKDSSQIGSILSTKPLSIDTSIKKANYVASVIADTKVQTVDTNKPATSPSLTFNQYNNSPKALSAVDLYRQTKNQLSAAKGALQKVS